MFWVLLFAFSVRPVTQLRITGVEDSTCDSHMLLVSRSGMFYEGCGHITALLGSYERKGLVLQRTTSDVKSETLFSLEVIQLYP